MNILARTGGAATLDSMRPLLLGLMLASCMHENPRASESPTAPLHIDHSDREAAVSERVHGLVHLGDGIFPTPVGSVGVELVADRRATLRTSTDLNGKFVFDSGVPFGTYELRVTGTHVGSTRITWRGAPHARFEVVARPRAD